MKFQWNDEKNEKLQNERGVNFEEVEEAIINGNLLAVERNPNRPNQIKLIVNLNDYAYCVPCVPEKEYYFLKNNISGQGGHKEIFEKGW